MQDVIHVIMCAISLSCICQVKCYEEAGQVCERMADSNPFTSRSWLGKAAMLYKEGGHAVKQLYILEQLGYWEAGAFFLARHVHCYLELYIADSLT